MYRFHRYNLIRWDISSPSVAYKLFVRGLYDYVIVKEETSSSVTTRSYFVASKGIEASWSNRASLIYSNDIQGRKLVNEGQNWIEANGGSSFTGLLDTYSGATAAFSLRKLSSSYLGDCITVRRSSDNATQSIGFVNNELDSTALNAFCSGSNGFVTTWYDQSGNGIDALNPVASEQPKIYEAASGVITENGKSALLFDGVNDKLITSQNITNGTNPASFFWAGNIYNVESPIFGKESGANRGLGFSQEEDRYRVYAEFFNSNDHFAVPILNQQVLLDFVMINGVSDFYENGVQIPLSAPQLQGIDFFGDTRAIGSNFKLRYFDGVMQEFILYHTDQTTDRQAIENNINDRYSIYP